MLHMSSRHILCNKFSPFKTSFNDCSLFSLLTVLFVLCCPEVGLWMKEYETTFFNCSLEISARMPAGGLRVQRCGHDVLLI